MPPEREPKREAIEPAPLVGPTACAPEPPTPTLLEAVVVG